MVVVLPIGFYCVQVVEFHPEPDLNRTVRSSSERIAISNGASFT